MMNRIVGMRMLASILFCTMAACAPASAANGQECVRPDAYGNIGPPRTVAELERDSLEEMKRKPGARQVPFGYQNKQWLQLKAALRPGDTLHKYASEGGGGILVLRNGCVVNHLLEWIR